MPLLLVLAFTALAATPAQVQAHVPGADGTTFATMVGNEEFPGGWTDAWVWGSDGSTVDVVGSVEDGFVVNLVGEPGLSDWRSFDLQFLPAVGEHLSVGVHGNAEPESTRSPGQPGFDIFDMRHECFDPSASFTILDVAADLSRLHLTYEWQCEERGASIFGEVRYNMPGGSSDLVVTPGRVDWPDQGVARAGLTVPVTLINLGDSPITVTGASIDSASDAFKMVPNEDTDLAECSTIAAGEHCAISVSFTPASVSGFAGSLVVTDSTTEGSHTVALTGRGVLHESTFVTMFGDDDFSATPEAWTWRAGDAYVVLSGAADSTVRTWVSGGSAAPNQDFFLDFAAPPGQSLAVGSYENAERPAARAEGQPGLDIVGRSCPQVSGEFTVLDISPDLSRLHIIYEWRCDPGSASVFGEVRYGIPRDDADLLAISDRIDWPDQPATTAARTVPVTLVNTGMTPLTVSGAAVTAGGDTFDVVSNECSTIAVGGYCRVNVTFKPAAVGDYTGTLTIADSTAAGTHTVALAGSGSPAPPNVTLSASRSIYAYGQSVVLTGKLTGGHTSTSLSFYRKYTGGTRVLVATREVDATGRATVSLPARENATYSVDWAEGDAFDTASVTALVRARMTLSMARYQRKSGSYYLYRPRGSMVTRAVLVPGKANRCVYVTAQVKVSGTWRAVRRTACIRTASNGSASTYLPYSRYLLGRPLRFRAVFKGDSRNASVVSAWRYAKYVR